MLFIKCHKHCCNESFGSIDALQAHYTIKHPTCTYFRFNRKLYYSITTNMDDEEKLYYIVEFSDGMQLIPSNWFTASKTKAYWPSFTNVKKYDKAVQSMESVGKN